MNPREFYELAKALSRRQGPAELRSSISRAYYASYLSGRSLLNGLGLPIAKNLRGHGMLQQRLSHSSNAIIKGAGEKLKDLHSYRIQADYDMDENAPEKPGTAAFCVLQAKQIIDTLDQCQSEPLRTQLKNTVEDYNSRFGSTF